MCLKIAVVLNMIVWKIERILKYVVLVIYIISDSMLHF